MACSRTMATIWPLLDDSSRLRWRILGNVPACQFLASGPTTAASDKRRLWAARSLFQHHRRCRLLFGLGRRRDEVAPVRWRLLWPQWIGLAPSKAKCALLL